MPKLPYRITTWENFRFTILALPETQEFRQEFEHYCDSDVFTSLKVHLNAYHELPDPKKSQEEGFKLLTMIHEDFEVLESVTSEFIRTNPISQDLFLGVLNSERSFVQENMIAIGTENSAIEDIFHLINISPSFGEYYLGNVEAWLVAQSRKPSPSTVNFWTDRDNILVNELYNEICTIAIAQVMDTWRNRFPEKATIMQRLNDVNRELLRVWGEYQENPSVELWQQLQFQREQFNQVKNDASRFIEEFKSEIPEKAIPIQDRAFRYVRNYPRDQWDNLRLRFMQEELNVPENRLNSYLQKLNRRHDFLEKIETELPGKYPHFVFNDVQDIFGVNPDLLRFYERELLLRMDYRAASKIFSLMALKYQGGNVLKTSATPEFNTAVRGIVELYTEAVTEEGVRVNICDSSDIVQAAVKERVLQRKLLQSERPIDVFYNMATVGDKQRIDAIWTALDELPVEGLFKTVDQNSVFKNYFKISEDLLTPGDEQALYLAISSRTDSEGLSAVIEQVAVFNRQIEKILPMLSRNITLESVRAFRDEQFTERYYVGLDDEARDYMWAAYDAQSRYRVGRFLEKNTTYNDLLMGGLAIQNTLDTFYAKRYGRNFVNFLNGIKEKLTLPGFSSYFVNRFHQNIVRTSFDIMDNEAYNVIGFETNSVFMRGVQRLLRFQEFFDTRAIRFYELANKIESQTIQFLPQDLLLSSFEYPEGLCIGLSLLQGLADDLNGTDIFTSDIAAVSALQLSKQNDTLSMADEKLYNQFTERLQSLNRSANKNFLDKKTSIFKDKVTATADTISEIINKLLFGNNTRFLLTTPNHAMTLSFKGDSYTFYDSNIGYVSFDSQEKVGKFIQEHLDLAIGLGKYYDLEGNKISIFRYNNTDLSVFEELNYFTGILKKGGVSLTVEALQNLDQQNGAVKFGEISFKRTELVAMGGKYNLIAIDEHTPFGENDFWDKVSFSVEKLFRFMNDNEANADVMSRLETLKAAGKLQTDEGVLLTSDLTGGKATGHVEQLHYNILQAAEHIADVYDKFSFKFDSLLDNLGIDLEDYKFKNSLVEKLEDHQYKITLQHKETGEEQAIVMDCKELETAVQNHVNTLVGAAEPALVLAGAGLGLMGLIRGATALRGGHGSSYDIAAVTLGSKQLADAVLGTMAMFIVGNTLAESGTIFTFSIEGTLANLCAQTAVKIGGFVGKLLSSLSVFLRLPLVGLTIWGLYEDVTHLNNAGSGPERAVAISQLVMDSIVAALTLGSFAVPELAVPVLIVSAVGLGINAIVQNLATAHERYYQFIKWQDTLRNLASPELYRPSEGVADLSRNQIYGAVHLQLGDDKDNPYQLTYTKSGDNAMNYGHHPEKTPQQIRNEVDYGYPSTAPIPPFAREEFTNPDKLPFLIGSGSIHTVILGFGMRYQLMSQVEYISDWLLYDERNKRNSGGYWETFFTRQGYDSIQQDGASCTVVGNSKNNVFMIPNIVDWSKPEEASFTIEKFSRYEFNITTGPGNNIVILGQTGKYKLVGGSGNNTLDMSYIVLNTKLDLDITGFQNVYAGTGRYTNCIKVAASNFNIVKCSAAAMNLKRFVTVKGATDKPNVFILGGYSNVTVYGRGGGNTYIVSEIKSRKREYAQQVNLHMQPSETTENIQTNITLERIHFENYKLLDFSSVTFSLDTASVPPVLSVEGFFLQSLSVDGFTLHNNAVENILFSTKDGFSFYFDNTIKKGVVTQLDFDKWKQFNPAFKEIFNFDLFNNVYGDKFVLAEDIVCVNTSGTIYMKMSTKKAVLLANSKTETITIPLEFKDFFWTVSTNHSIHSIAIKSYMCNATKPLIVLDGHALVNIKNTVDLSDFGKEYTMMIGKERSAMMITLTKINVVGEQLDILFKDVFHQDITFTLANTDIVLSRGKNNIVKISDLVALCRDFSPSDKFTLPFAQM